MIIFRIFPITSLNLGIALLQINVRFHLPCTDQLEDEKRAKRVKENVYSKDRGEIWHTGILAELTSRFPYEEYTNQSKYTQCSKMNIFLAE